MFTYTECEMGVNADFPGGDAIVWTSHRWTRQECGCTVYLGKRVDTRDKTMLNFPCPEHLEGWQIVVDEIMADQLDATADVLERGVQKLITKQENA